MKDTIEDAIYDIFGDPGVIILEYVRADQYREWRRKIKSVHAEFRRCTFGLRGVYEIKYKRYYRVYKGNWSTCDVYEDKKHYDRHLVMRNKYRNLINLSIRGGVTLRKVGVKYAPKTELYTPENIAIHIRANISVIMGKNIVPDFISPCYNPQTSYIRQLEIMAPY